MHDSSLLTDKMVERCLLDHFVQSGRLRVDFRRPWAKLRSCLVDLVFEVIKYAVDGVNEPLFNLTVLWGNTLDVRRDLLRKITDQGNDLLVGIVKITFR